MDIKFGRSVNDITCNFVNKDYLGSGFENMPYAFEDKKWYNLQELYETECDVAIVNALWGNPPNLEYLIEKGKSPKWKKLYLFCESGISPLNHIDYLDALFRVSFDGYIAYSSKLLSLLEIFKILNKEVLYTTIPFPFDFYPDLQNSVKKENKICLDLSRFHDPHGNFLSSLNVMKKLAKKGYYSVSYIDENLVPKVKGFVDRFLLQDSMFVFSSTGWKEYINNAKDCKIFLSMDSRYTWGRFALDAALVGSICVGTYSEVQEIIYPEFVTELNDIDKTVSFVESAAKINNNFVIPKHIKEKFSYNYVKNNLKEKLNG